MIENLSPSQIFTGTVTIIGGVALILKKLNFIQIGKKNGGCPNTAKVTKNTEDIAELDGYFTKFKEAIYPKINQTAEDVSFIKGWINGQKE